MFMVYPDYHNRRRFSYKESSLYITRGTTEEAGRQETRKKEEENLYTDHVTLLLFCKKTIVTSVNIPFRSSPSVQNKVIGTLQVLYMLESWRGRSLILHACNYSVQGRCPEKGTEPQ
jgi:hypothetical protein